MNSKSHAIRILVSKGAELEAKDTIGRTALRWAIANNNHVEVTLLKSLGANTNWEDLEGGSSNPVNPKPF